jgi:hypothetical protein
MKSFRVCVPSGGAPTTTNSAFTHFSFSAYSEASRVSYSHIRSTFHSNTNTPHWAAKLAGFPKRAVRTECSAVFSVPVHARPALWGENTATHERDQKQLQMLGNVM